MVRTVIGALAFSLLAAACAGPQHVATTAAYDAGYLNARVLSSSVDAPMSMGCSPEDRVAYRMWAMDPKRDQLREFTVCCGPKRERCEVIDD